MKAIIMAVCLACLPLQGSAQELLLAKEFKGQDVAGWAMSEKLDGVRAYWNGRQLVSRQGYAFTPPAGFTRGFPPYPLDGELYSARGQFEQISAAVRGHSGDWRGIRLHVFDVPKAQGDLYRRLAVLQAHLQAFPNEHLVVVAQTPVRDNRHALAEMERVAAAGGEGVVVRNPAVAYGSGRSSDFLKLKPQQDAECTVVAHYEGKGKYAGKLGALGCENAVGRFKIGSGFTDAEREQPPAIGSVITYRHRGFTQQGLPRFATYWRVRADR